MREAVVPEAERDAARKQDIVQPEYLIHEFYRGEEETL
jgi:hypothetical protein